MEIAARILRLALALALVALASGVPQAVSAAAGECCGERCDAPFDGECPPGCTSGTCAKVLPGAILGSPGCGDVEPATLEGAAPGAAEPSLPLVRSGVFHPPRG